MHLNVQTASPGHTARLAKAVGVATVHDRVLAYHDAPPTSQTDPLAAQREIVKPLYARPGGVTLSSSGSGSLTKSGIRKLPSQPERVLDAPGMVDDFYLNILSWSALNVLGVALGESCYTWTADTGNVSHLGDAPDGTYYSAVEFSTDGAFLALGTGSGAVELWDVETGTKLRTMTGHSTQIPSLAWNGHVATSGCGDGSIWHHDVRVAKHKVQELLGHKGEVCGLKWNMVVGETGALLASGGNDNVVNVWDWRTDGEVFVIEEESRTKTRLTKRSHTAAVKVSFISCIANLVF